MNLAATLSLDNKGFLNPLAGAQQAVSGAVGGMKSAFAGLAAITAGAGALGLAFLGVKKAIHEAADMETMETSFSVLLGSMDAAKARMAELSKFAAATPFELPEIAAASRTLETLTRGALSTGKGLTLVGDVASGVNQPFAEVATTVGRLYDGLMNGRPVGEAMQRLGELGVISGETRTRIEELQKTGAKGAEVWGIAEAAMGRFTGMMDKQSGTWNGLMSTLQDNITAVFREFGTPLIDALKPMLTGAITLADQLSAKAREWGTAVAEGIRTVKNLFDQGTLWEAAGLALQIGFGKAANFLIATLKAGFSALISLLGGGLTAAFKSIGDGQFWTGLGTILKGLAAQFGAAITTGISTALQGVSIFGKKIISDGTAAEMAMSAKLQSAKGAQDVRTGGQMIANSGTGQAAVAAVLAALNDFKVTFKDSKDAIDLGGLQARLEELLANAKPKPAPEMYGPPMPPPGLAAAAAGAAAGPAAAKSYIGDRLAKIGLFVGAGGPANDHARKTADNTQALRTLFTRGLEIWGRMASNPAPIATVG